MLSASYSISGCLHKHDWVRSRMKTKMASGRLLVSREWRNVWGTWKMPACYIDACRAVADSIGWLKTVMKRHVDHCPRSAVYGTAEVGHYFVFKRFSTNIESTNIACVILVLISPDKRPRFRYCLPYLKHSICFYWFQIKAIKWNCLAYRWECKM